MKHCMIRNVEIWLILTIVVVTGLVSAFWASAHAPVRPFEPRPDFPYRVPEDIELFYTIKTVVSTINVALLIYLLLTYINIYTETRSDFTIGLAIFSMVLLFYALSSNPMIHSIFGFRAFGLGPFAMLPDLFTCAALAVLLYLTVRY